RGIRRVPDRVRPSARRPRRGGRARGPGPHRLPRRSAAMSATTLAPGATSPTASRTSPYRLSFAHVLRSEWIKFRSLRSTWWTLGITVVVMVGFSLMFAAVVTSVSGQGGSPGYMVMGATDCVGVMVITVGYSFAQLEIGRAHV